MNIPYSKAKGKIKGGIRRAALGIVAAAMVFAALPSLSASAEDTERTFLFNTANGLEGIAQDDMIYFGKYGGNSLNWRVLSKDGNGSTYNVSDAKPMFLLSENLIAKDLYLKSTTLGSSCTAIRTVMYMPGARILQV